MIKNLPLIFSSSIIGIILFQSALVAPAVNKLIHASEASVFLRYIWPKFFIIICVISFISFLIIAINSNQNLLKYLSFTSFLLMLICYLITPSINEAKDSLDQQLWTVLHMLTIILTLITLILNSLIIIYWKYLN
tara:strand:+ start:9420 stop:9824 length:405 start_codon:yes stop_codon:yes gene_type:complete